MIWIYSVLIGFELVEIWLFDSCLICGIPACQAGSIWCNDNETASRSWSWRQEEEDEAEVEDEGM